MTRLIILVACTIALAGCAGPESRQPTFQFTELAFPDAASTAAAGINDAGHVVGWYGHADRTSGYIYKDGAFSSIDYPGAVLTQLTGLAANGEMVGSYRKAGETEQFNGQSLAYHGFLRTASGEFLEVNHPDHKYTFAQRIVADGTVFGCYHDEDFTKTMYAISIPRQAITAEGVPRSAIAVIDTPATMSNGATPDRSKIVGFDMANGKAYIIERGTLTTFEAPGAARTEAWDINPSGVIVGVFVDSASVEHGYVLENGNFTTIDYPGAKSTVAFGINARGDIVGAFGNADGRRRGYIATRK